MPPARRGLSTAPTTATTGPATTTTTAPEPYSFEPAPKPPPLINTGTDYVAITKSLLEYGSWLLSHQPDVALLHDVVVTGTDLHDSYSDDIAILTRTNRRLVEETTAPDEIKIVSTSADAISLMDMQHLSRQIVIDANGVTVSQRKRTPTKYSVLLTRTGDRWLLASVTETTPSPEVGL